MNEDQIGTVAVSVIILVGALLTRTVIRAAEHGSLAPNFTAGFRTSATRSSVEAWQAGHRAGRPWTDRGALVAAALAVAAGALALAAQTDVALVLLVLSAVVLLVAVLAGGVTAHRAADVVRRSRA